MTTFLEVQDAALHDDFDATKYRSIAKVYLNEAVALIYRNTSLAAGDVTLTATVDVGDSFEAIEQQGLLIQSITRADTGEEIVYLDRDEFEQLANELGSSRTGPPAYYTITGMSDASTSVLSMFPFVSSTMLLFLPLADQQYTLDIVARFSPAQMSGDSDTIPLPPDYAYFPVRYARSKMFALEDDEQMSVFWMGEWLSCLQAIRQDLNRRRIGVRQTPSMWASLDTGPRFHHPQGLF